MKSEGPELVRPLGRELPVDLVERARRLAVTDRRSHDFAARHPAQPEPAHQAFDRASRCLRPFASQLAPDLVGNVDLHVGSPDALDLPRQNVVALGSFATSLGAAPKRGMTSIPGRGNLQDLADRLDPESIAMLVDQIPQDLNRRSSSARAKNALATFRISLARRTLLAIQPSETESLGWPSRDFLSRSSASGSGATVRNHR